MNDKLEQTLETRVEQDVFQVFSSVASSDNITGNTRVKDLSLLPVDYQDLSLRFKEQFGPLSVPDIEPRDIPVTDAKNWISVVQSRIPKTVGGIAQYFKNYVRTHPTAYKGYQKEVA